MSDPERYTVTFGLDELVALAHFMSYGATRGNHSEIGNGPGPLSDHVAPITNLYSRMREARREAMQK